ncbi:Inner membrane protein ybaN [Weissella viridescens]|uniref:Inner membrane protein ybaN n=1 Tax=Weissella viridescens TaxID=1629 RepID=A0A380P733_WEIVI|nr:Inner membrane protein ybaN [Weissella viridescens]
MRYLYILLGLILFSIGTVAIWIPGLPTTGFYFFAAFCWARSSPRLHAWLIRNKYYQRYVEEGVYQRKLSQKQRIAIYAMSAGLWQSHSLPLANYGYN